MKSCFAIFAAILFALAGVLMLAIRGATGDTSLEAFFHAAGVFSFGVAAFTIFLWLPSNDERLQVLRRERPREPFDNYRDKDRVADLRQQRPPQGFSNLPPERDEER